MAIRRRLVLLAALLVMAGSAFAIDAPAELTIAHNAGNVVLRWHSVVGATEYNVYKETSEITDVTLLFPYATVQAPTVSYTDGALTTQHYYVVTAVVPSGDASGTILDTTGLGANGALVYASLQGDPSVFGLDYADANGNYEILDLPVGTYDICVYKENRPVGTDVIVVTDGGITDWDYQWAPFSRVHIAAGILAAGNYSWTNNNVYELDGIFRVGPGATLDIQEGTTVNGSSVILGTGFPTLTFINVMASTTGDGSDNGVMNVSGTKYKPVVFTSGRLPANGVQQNSDWGGLIIDGDATTNRGRLATGEGGTGPYGNLEANASDTQSSGTATYFRSDFAGFNFTASNQLNGVCFQGCGSGTDYSYYQSYQGEDDGTEFFGGRNSVHHVIIFDTGDDGFDYTSGWQGTAHHVFVVQRRNVSDQCIEADNHTTEPGESDEYDALPRANSKLANFTLIGQKGSPAAASSIAKPRAGTQFNWFNMLFTLGGTSAIDLDNSQTALAGVGGASRIDYSLFWDNGGAATEVISATTGAGIGDGHFLVENAEWNLAPACSAPAAFPINSTIAAPTGWMQDLANYRGCSFLGSNATTVIANPMLASDHDGRPAAGSPALNAASAAPAGVITSYGLPYSAYIGAFSGPNDDWQVGWSR